MIFSMCLCKGNLFLSPCEGISKVSLQTAECNTVVQLDDELCMLTRFGSEIVRVICPRRPSSRLLLLSEDCKDCIYNNLEPFNYRATNLLSCMTLDVENCHSTVHIKQVNMSRMEYTVDPLDLP